MSTLTDNPLTTDVTLFIPVEKKTWLVYSFIKVFILFKHIHMLNVVRAPYKFCRIE